MYWDALSSSTGERCVSTACDVTWLTPFGVFERITSSHSPSSFMKGFFSKGPL